MAGDTRIGDHQVVVPLTADPYTAIDRDRLDRLIVGEQDKGRSALRASGFSLSFPGRRLATAGGGRLGFPLATQRHRLGRDAELAGRELGIGRERHAWRVRKRPLALARSFADEDLELF